jgi:hypothetical protein
MSPRREDDGAGEGTVTSRDCPPDLREIARALDEAAAALRRHARAARSWPTYPGAVAPTTARPEPVEGLPSTPATDITAPLVRAIIAVRWLRASFLPDAPGDHAFSMLLELYAAHLEGRRVAQTRLAGAAAVPHASAIRIARALLADGLATAGTDPADRRLVLLGLSDEAVARMEAYLRAALGTGAPVL